MKRGRPKWMPPDLQQVKKLAARGLTQEEIAHCLGISYQTLNERKKELAEFADAIKKGQAEAHASAAHVVQELIFKEKDRSMLMFFLERRCGWTKTIHNEMGGIKGGEPIAHKVEAPDIKSALQKVIDSVVRE